MRFAFLYLLPRVVLARIGYSLKDSLGLRIPREPLVNVGSLSFFFLHLEL